MTITDPLAVPAAGLHALPALLTVAETAQVLRVGRSWVYEHAAELGAVKLGTGQTAPLRIPRDGCAAHGRSACPLRGQERRWEPAPAGAGGTETAKGVLRPPSLHGGRRAAATLN